MDKVKEFLKYRDNNKEAIDNINRCIRFSEGTPTPEDITYYDNLEAIHKAEYAEEILAREIAEAHQLEIEESHRETIDQEYKILEAKKIDLQLIENKKLVVIQGRCLDLLEEHKYKLSETFIDMVAFNIKEMEDLDTLESDILKAVREYDRRRRQDQLNKLIALKDARALKHQRYLTQQSETFKGGLPIKSDKIQKTTNGFTLPATHIRENFNVTFGILIKSFKTNEIRYVAYRTGMDFDAAVDDVINGSNNIYLKDYLSNIDCYAEVNAIKDGGTPKKIWRKQTIESNITIAPMYNKVDMNKRLAFIKAQDI